MICLEKNCQLHHLRNKHGHISHIQVARPAVMHTNFILHYNIEHNVVEDFVYVTLLIILINIIFQLFFN